MRTVAEHQDAVRALLAPLGAGEPYRWSGDLAAAASLIDPYRVLHDDVVSPIDHPPFDNSQMDGYAVRAGEVVPGRALVVAPPIAAGQPVGRLEPGTAAPIMTGAAVPVGADAIVPIELAVPDRFQSEPDARVSFHETPAHGAFIRPRGSDLPRGSVLLPAGTRLGAAQWGILAASGITRLALRRRLSVLVVSSGDELQRPGVELGDGRIYDANSAAMAAAITTSGARVARVLTVTDDADGLRARLAEELIGIDLILTTGGVSKGAYEVVRDVFEPAGVRFLGVGMQPGGPQGLGLAELVDDAGRSARIPVVAFPGNPVSALVSFELFLRPVLRALHGLPAYRAAERAPLAAALDSPSAKHQVRRGRFDANGRVELVGGASSHLLHGYATSTLLVHVPAGVSHLDAGDPVDVWRIDD